ncbi:hypothetical protein GCM10020220_074460 [Nonomuraea rubra]|uniref:acyltransferase family protein n=1 Tax=Nonomuraea rubra TaxID=46180 RepID=UPI0031E61700
MKTGTRTRLYAIDNLRILLTALVVAHHVAITYGNIPLWYYVEPAKDPSGIALDILVVTNQAFFMGFFFLLSGFFTPGSYDRKGAPARSSATGWCGWASRCWSTSCCCGRWPASAACSAGATCRSGSTTCARGTRGPCGSSRC